MDNSRKLAAAALISLAGAAFAHAGGPPLAGSEGLLLLRGGEVIRGRITPEGDRYHVVLATGGVWVKAADVEAHCGSLEEGYWFKRRAMPLGNVHSHLDLAQWCLQHDLPGHAANELRDALAVDPHHPRIDLLARRLKVSQQKTPPPLASSAATADAAPSADDLDRLTRSLPAGAVETFTNSIQPLLINSCTAAGCHGPAAERGPRWVRVSLGRTSSRRLTQRNLHATLELLNRDKPLESPLLVVPAQPHGSSKTAVFNDLQSAQYRQLVAWVQQVAPVRATPQPASVVSQTPPLLQTMPPGVVQRVNFEAPLPNPPPSDEQPAETPADEAPPLIRVGPGTPPARSEAQRGETPTGFRPRDPFDPEIFNRRFFPERSAR
jgi:hypothetical protein